MAKYIDVEMLGIGMANPAVFNDPAFADGWNSAIKILQDAPAADVRPVVRGEWLWNGDGMYYFCSCCNYRAFGCTLEIRDGEYGFCPNCGTDMREESDSNV